MGPDENHKTLVHSVSQDENEVLNTIVGIIEWCWNFREKLDWCGSDVNIRIGIKLMKDLSKSENKILKLMEDIHLEDKEYEAHELARCLKLLAALLNRHDQTIKEISKLHQDFASDCSGEDCDENVSSYKAEMEICFEDIKSIRTTLKNKKDQAIQLYLNKKRETMKIYIKDKALINDNDNADKPTLMKYVVDEECMTINEWFPQKSRRSRIILSLWKVMEEEIGVELLRKKKKLFIKPSRFHILKEALKIMRQEKIGLKESDVILALELDRLENMLQEVIVLSDDTNTLISKVLRQMAESTVVDFEDPNTDGIKLGARLAFTPDTGNLRLECIHLKQVPLREEGKKTNIRLEVRLISDGDSEVFSEVFKDINTSYVFALQAATPPVFKFNLEHLSFAFIVINIFHVNKARIKVRSLGECVIQVKKNGHLLPELEEKSEDDFEDALTKSYCLGDYPEVYKSLEYLELSRRPESAAKKIVEGKKKRQSFFME